jgi:hypothetical protein
MWRGEARTSRDAVPYLTRMVFASGWRLGVMRQQVPSTQHSMQHSELCTQHSALRLFQLQLTVLVGRGIQLVRSRARETRHGIMKGQGSGSAVSFPLPIQTPADSGGLTCEGGYP